MKELNTIEEIKAAADAGTKVYAGSRAYQVVKDRIGQYLIVCDATGYCIGLHGREGTQYENKLNAQGFFHD